MRKMSDSSSNSQMSVFELSASSPTGWVRPRAQRHPWEDHGPDLQTRHSHTYYRQPNAYRFPSLPSQHSATIVSFADRSSILIG
jgi:hypothetical protein